MGIGRERITLRIEIDDDWRTSDRLQVYTDFGDGTIDTNSPLLRATVPIFPDDHRDDVEHAGYGEDPYGEFPYGGYGTIVGPDYGYGFDPYGEVDYGGTIRAVEIPIVVDSTYASWKFAAQVFDGAGNEQGALDELERFISGQHPAPLSAFAFAAYNGTADTVSFDFTL